MNTRIATFVCLLAGLVLAGGCGQLTIRESQPRTSSAAGAAAPPVETRSAGELRQENAGLRQQVEKLEKEDRNWVAAIDQKKDETRDLKRQRDDLKKDRDKYKKMLKD